MAQLTLDKGITVSQDGTVYSEFLVEVRSQTKVWQAVKHEQKSLPQDVFESIKATFSGAGAREDVVESVEAMPEVAGTSFQREGTDSANVITLASGAIREGADTGSSQSFEFPSSPPLETSLSLLSSGLARLHSSIDRLHSCGGAASCSGGADAERFKLSNLDWGSNDDDGLHDRAAIASDPLRQCS